MKKVYILVQVYNKNLIALCSIDFKKKCKVWAFCMSTIERLALYSPISSSSLAQNKMLTSQIKAEKIQYIGKNNSNVLNVCTTTLFCFHFQLFNNNTNISIMLNIAFSSLFRTLL